MNPIGIIADDLTGASDTGVQFSRLGARVAVLVAPGRHGLLAKGHWDVVVVNTNSRHQSPGRAQRLVSEALSLLRDSGIPVRYKKIDSTLRGNLCPELKPLLRQAETRLVLAPAFPLAGRTVEGGVVKVGGIPVSNTEIGADRLTPVPESHLPTLLGKGLSVPVATLAGLSRHPDHSEIGLLETAKVLVCDATTPEHLARLAVRLTPLLEHCVAVGSAGLARELAARLVPSGRRVGSPPQPKQGTVLVIAGSRTRITQTQLRELAREDGVLTHPLHPSIVAESWEAPAMGHWVERALGLVEGAVERKHGVVVVRIAQSGLPTQSGLKFHQQSQRLNRVLATLALGVARDLPLRGLVLTGGDIALSVMRALKINTLELGAEVLPGIPMGWAVDGVLPGLPLITKAGGFGDSTALTTAVQALKDLHQHAPGQSAAGA